MRHGPKPKLIKDRRLKPEDLRPIRRKESSWSQRQKIRVLVFLYHHCIPTCIPADLDSITCQYRAPTQWEASEIYGVPQTTISEWVRKQAQFESLSSSITCIPHTAILFQWPELESMLYCLFLESRERGQAVWPGWFRIQSFMIFRDLFPNADDDPICGPVFRFSNGWFRGFLRRYRISFRCVTKKAQSFPEDYCQMIHNWLQFNRRNSQSYILRRAIGSLPNPGSWLETILNHTVGRYDLSNICDLDETPLPFEYLNGQTYDPVGCKTIWVKRLEAGGINDKHV